MAQSFTDWKLKAQLVCSNCHHEMDINPSFVDAFFHPEICPNCGETKINKRWSNNNTERRWWIRRTKERFVGTWRDDWSLLKPWTWGTETEKEVEVLEDELARVLQRKLVHGD